MFGGDACRQFAHGSVNDLPLGRDMGSGLHAPRTTKKTLGGV